MNAQAINEQEANEPTEEQEQEEQHTEAQPLSEAHHVKTNALFTVDSLAFVAILLDSHSFIIRISANMCFVTYGRASARYAYTLIDAVSSLYTYSVFFFFHPFDESIITSQN